MTSGAVVRLQNLPWSASASDIREFFYGYEIPNGGVRIIGGDDGDCFVAFVKRADAQDALRKDRSLLKDQQIRLYASSEEEMHYIIAIAKGENPPKPDSVYARDNMRDNSYDRKQPSSSATGEQPPSHYGSRATESYGSARDTQPVDNSGAERYFAGRQVDIPPYGNHAAMQNPNNNHLQGSGDPTRYSNYHQYDKFSNNGSAYSGKQGFSASTTDSGDFSPASSDPNRQSNSRNLRTDSFPNITNDNRQTMGMHNNTYSNAPSQNFPMSNTSAGGSNIQMPNQTSVSYHEQETNNRNTSLSNDRSQQQNHQRQFEGQPHIPAVQTSRFSQPSRGLNQPSSFRDSSQRKHDPSVAHHYQQPIPEAKQGMSSSDAPTFHNEMQQQPEQLGRHFESTQVSRDSQLQNPSRYGENHSMPHQGYHGNSGFNAGGNEPSLALLRQVTGFKPSHPTDVDQRRPPPENFQFQPQNQSPFNSHPPMIDRDDRVDSDLRSGPSTRREGRPAAASKSVPLLPTPDIKPSVFPLLDVELPSNVLKMDPMSASVSGKFDVPPPRLPETMVINPLQNLPNHPNFQPQIPPPSIPGNTSFPMKDQSLPMQQIGPHGQLQQPQGPEGNMNHQNDSRRFGAPHNEPLDMLRHPNQPHDMYQQPMDVHGSTVPTMFQQDAGPAHLQRSNSSNIPNSSMQEGNASHVVPVTDPCVYFTNLPPDVQFKQMRGLFATHCIIARDIKIIWPPRPYTDQDRATAVALFESINATVVALNELKGMKIAGHVIHLQPCLKQKYDEFQTDPCVRGSAPKGSFQSQSSNTSKRSWDEKNRRDSSNRHSPERSITRRNTDSSIRDTQGRHGRSPLRDSQSKRSRSPHRSRSPRNLDRDSRRLPQYSDRDMGRGDNRFSRLRRLGDRAEFRMGDRPEPRAGDRPGLRMGDRSEPRLSDRSDPRIGDRSDPRMDDRPDHRMSDRPDARMSDRSDPRMDDRSGPRMDDRSGPRMDDRSGPRTDDRSGPRMDDRSGPRMDDRSGPRMDDRSGPRINERPNPRMSDRPDQRMLDRPYSRMNERPDPRMDDGSDPRMSDRPDPRMNDRLGHRLGDRSGPRIGDRLGPRMGNVSEPKTSDQPGSKISDRHGNRMGNRPEASIRDRSEYQMQNAPSNPKDHHQDSSSQRGQEIPRSSQIQQTDSSSSPSWSAVLTGLPPKVTKSDVEKFLTDIQYDSSTLYIEFNVHGECTGTAYVQLATEHSLKMLMNSPEELLKQTIHVNSVTKEQMTKCVEEHKKSLATDKTKPGEFVLQLTGLPMDATPRTVSEFLYPTKIKESEVTIVKSPDGSGRCTGAGFVKVHSLDDREEALKHDRGYIGKRYVTIRVVSEQAMKDLLSKHEGKVPQMSEVKAQSNPSHERVVRMVNLRYDIKSEQIVTFFRDFNPEINSIFFTMQNGMPTGKGTIRMKTAADAKKAVEEMNKKELAGRPLLLSLSRC